MPKQREHLLTTHWILNPEDSGFPAKLAKTYRECDERDVHGIGDASILKQPSLGLICSVQCPGNIVIQTFDAIRTLRDSGVLLAGGFHSPMERECLDFLLRGQQPVIVCKATGLKNLRLPKEFKIAIDEGRMIVISSFATEVSRTTKATAQERNDLVADLASAILVPHASGGGQAEALSMRCLNRGQPLFTFPAEENSRLIELGARPFDLDQVRQLVTSCPATAGR